MKWICDKRCFQCKHPDCINDQPPSLSEIAIIEADDRYVRYWQRTDADRERLKNSREYRRKYVKDNHETVTAKRKDEKTKALAYERTKLWRKKRREGVAI